MTRRVLRPDTEQPEPERIECVCGRRTLAKNWANHLLSEWYAPHARLRSPENGLTAEEARLLQLLDLIEHDLSAGGRMRTARVMAQLERTAR